MRAALNIQPMIISNGSESGWLMPAHLATIGFYVLRVRSNLVAQRDLGELWRTLEEQLRAALNIQPWIISNASASSWLMPSHLATMGFYVLRVRSNLVEIRQVLDR